MGHNGLRGLARDGERHAPCKLNNVKDTKQHQKRTEFFSEQRCLEGDPKLISLKLRIKLQ